jgi:Domain of unknown function (DUF4388)
MVQLNGNLAGMGLPTLLDLLARLQASGRLTLVIEPLMGIVFLEEGRIVGATLDSEQGLSALQALAFISGNAMFAFSDWKGEVERNVQAEPTELQEQLAQLAQEGDKAMSVIPSLLAIPRLTVESERSDEPLRLGRTTLQLLLDARSRRTVVDLASQYGLRITLQHLYQLTDLGLISLELPVPATPRTRID